MKYKLIVPPIHEILVTGFALGAEKTINESLWRIEIYRGEEFPRVFQDGKQKDLIATCPNKVIKFANNVVSFFNNSVKEVALNRV